MRSDSSMAPIETPPDKSHWSGFVRGMRLGLLVAPGIIVRCRRRRGRGPARPYIRTKPRHEFSGLLRYRPTCRAGNLACRRDITVAVLAAVVGARLFLMSVSMRPWLGQRPAWQAYSALFFLTDATWLIAMRYRAEGGSDVAVYFGAASPIMAA